MPVIRPRPECVVALQFMHVRGVAYLLPPLGRVCIPQLEHQLVRSGVVEHWNGIPFLGIAPAGQREEYMEQEVLLKAVVRLPVMPQELLGQFEDTRVGISRDIPIRG